MNDQLIFKFPKYKIYKKEDFYVSSSNQEAYNFVNSWPKWIRKIVNIFQTDVMYLAGLTRSLKLANMINKSGFTCTPHAANLSLVTVCTMHFLKAIPNAGKYLEYSIEGEDYYPWQKKLFSKHPFNIIEGNVEISDDPGWGVEIYKRSKKRKRFSIFKVSIGT